MKIKDKVIIVTGASSGIGKATAYLLSAEGAKVALVARSADKLSELQRELVDSFAVPTDMTDFEAIHEMVEKVHKHYGRIDALVNNAGRGAEQVPLEKVNIDKFRDLMELNVYGPIVAMQDVIPYLREVGGGAIVNIGSGTTKMLRAGGSVYPSTKQVVQQFSKVARLELAPDKIVVTVVHPYITDTNFFAHLDSNRRQSLLKQADSPEKVAKEILRALEHGEEEDMDEIDMSISHRM